MPKYYPSLEERRLRIIENCCGGDGGVDNSSDLSGDDMGSAEPEAMSGIEKALNKIKKKKKKIQEESPPGFEGTVKAMKDKKEIDNPYALAWWMKNKGYKSHKKKDGSDRRKD